MLKHLAGNCGACNGWRAKLRRVAADDQYLAKLDDLAGLAVEPVDPDHVFGGDPVLFAACPDDCEHLSSSCVRSRCSDDPDRLLSVGLLFVFNGLVEPSKKNADPRARVPLLMAGKRAVCQEKAHLWPTAPRWSWSG